jgi:hypothetical protein
MLTDCFPGRNRLLRRVLTAGLPLLLAACSGTGSGTGATAGLGGSAGAGGNAGLGGAPGGAGGTAAQQDGTITWHINGNTITAPGYYQSPSATWQSFAFEIGADYAMSGRACTFWGQFAAVPPVSGTYAIVDYRAPVTDGVFRAVCADGFSSGTAQGPQSQSGEIVLERSEVGAIEGHFTLRASDVTGDITGAFRVGCLATATTVECGSHVSGMEPGTCADLIACCARSFDKMTCMAKYAEAQPHGDAACANVLTFAKRSDCP